MYLCVCLCLCICVFPSGYKVASCNVNGRIDLKEMSESRLTCSEITTDYMLWDFTPSGENRIQVATCYWPSARCNNNDSDYAVTRPQYDTSTLTVRRNHRTKIAGVVRCGGTKRATVTFSAACSVRVVCKYAYC